VRVETLAAQPIYRLLQPGLVDIGKQHARTPAREFGGGGETDAARTASDDRRSPLEIS
jgi:hypothetical protein